MKLISSSGVTYSLDLPQTSIGRSPSCTIMLSDPRLSGQHATIYRDGDAYVLTDNNSTNGTFVNGNRLTGSHRLQIGDQIGVGGIVLTVASGSVGGTQPMSYPVQGPMSASPHVPASGYPAGSPYPAPPYAYPSPYPVKERSTVILLEVLLGLFGIPGVGWLYAGEVGTGLGFLFGTIAFACIEGFIAAFTVGISLCFTLPLHYVALLVSVLMLNSFIQNHPERFR